MLFLIIIAGIFLLEYGVKRHMDQVRTEKEQRPLANGRIILKKYYNTGAAGNFLSDRPNVMRGIHTAVLVFVCVVLLKIYPQKDAFYGKLGLSFLIGGGCSNLYDRLTKGHVVDYVSFGFGPKWFRKLVFNIADFFIFAGMILSMVFELLRSNRQMVRIL